MFCPKCGEKLPDDAKVCSKCGMAVGDVGGEEVGGMSNLSAGKEEVSDIGSLLMEKMDSLFLGENEEENLLSSSSYDTVFVEADEQLVGSLGNGYLANILYKKVKKCHALLTDRRIYFQGTIYSGSGKSLVQQKCEKIVDLEDITGTGFLYSRTFSIVRAILWIVLPWILALIASRTGIRIFGYRIGSDYYYGYGASISIPTVALICDVIIFIGLCVSYIKNRKTYFIIEYAGGAIRFNASIIGLSKVKEFQGQIRCAKEKRKYLKNRS